MAAGSQNGLRLVNHSHSVATLDGRSTCSYVCAVADTVGRGCRGKSPPQTKVNRHFKHNTNKTHNDTDFYNQNVC